MLEIAGGILLAYLIIVLIAMFIRPILYILATCILFGFVAGWGFLVHALFH